jgi:hypothetical protein
MPHSVALAGPEGRRGNPNFINDRGQFELFIAVDQRTAGRRPADGFVPRRQPRDSWSIELTSCLKNEHGKRKQMKNSGDNVGGAGCIIELYLVVSRNDLYPLKAFSERSPS